MKSYIVFLLALLTGAQSAAQALPNPIMFVTQVPIPSDFTTIGSTFGNQSASMDSAGRGGDLYIRYPDGSLRNLTAEAGFGMAGLQGATAIGVRDPEVSFDATKAIFSMAIGAPNQFVYNDYYWQLYEVTGLAQNQTAVITRVANQPANYNNIQPAYLSDGSIVFVSDRPRSGERHLYPQQDEYESAPTPTGLWQLRPSAGAGSLKLLQHSPSGSFDPVLDSYGRLLYTRWDHLQRDQQADVSGNPSGNFNWLSEAANAPFGPLVEVFPEPRISVGGNVNGHTLNTFLPWMIHQDGTAEETVNHVGRHELHSYFNRSFNDDPNLVEFIPGARNSARNITQLALDPVTPGRFLAIDPPEFATHGSGQIIAFNGAPSVNPDAIQVSFLTHPSTGGTVPGPNHTGHYRNVLVLSDGRVLAAHASEQGVASNLGTRAAPNPNHKFRLRLLQAGGAGFLTPSTLLTPGISKNISYYDPDVLVSYSQELWELSPVEVRARAVPPSTNEQPLAAPEVQAFAAEQVSVATFKADIAARGLALLVMRNVTTRDRADKQQPYNLRVPGGVETIGSGGRVYDISHFQMLQGDQIRGIGGSASPTPGRRVLANWMHDPNLGTLNLPNPGGPIASVPIASDGSVAVLVPSQRALTWQSTAPNGTPVVRERYWLTAQPGEIRTCDGCHGVNTNSQNNSAAASNSPIALRLLLARWKQQLGEFRNGFEN
jgi:Hydrazine synthase alpha subunit middle domain